MRNRGFVLIELVIVLVLVGFSIALVTPSLTRLSRATELKGTAQKVSSALRYCRSESINKGRIYQILFDSNLREIRIFSVKTETANEEEGVKKVFEKRYTLPGGIDIGEVKMGFSQYPSDLPVIEFYPNGGSNGGVILLDTPDHKKYRINVDFLTGMVQIEKV